MRIEHCEPLACLEILQDEAKQQRGLTCTRRPDTVQMPGALIRAQGDFHGPAGVRIGSQHEGVPNRNRWSSARSSGFTNQLLDTDRGRRRVNK